MSDEEVTVKRGGRKSAADSAVNKRSKKEVKPADSDEEAPPVKRGRGRPKGSSKKKTDKPKTNGTVGRRGRSKKKKDDDSAEENGAKSSAEEEEEDDE